MRSKSSSKRSMSSPWSLWMSVPPCWSVCGQTCARVGCLHAACVSMPAWSSVPCRAVVASATGIWMDLISKASAFQRFYLSKWYWPQAPAGADQQLLSADGAFVPLVGGEWAEVKTLLMGEVTRNKRGEVCTQRISCFSRLAEAERFVEAALVETHRRGLERAAAVCAVQDGAEWLQGLVDYHRADAVRILDFAHAPQYLNEIGPAVPPPAHSLPPLRPS